MVGVLEEQARNGCKQAEVVLRCLDVGSRNREHG
jgi:hypothetical protein